MSTKTIKVVFTPEHNFYLDGLSLESAKKIFDDTGVLLIDRYELFSNAANLLFHAYGPNIIIPEGVDSIGEHAFEGLPITSIKFPDSVKYIGESAFRNTNLTEVDLSGVIGISEYAFSKTPITSVKLSPNLYDLGPGAFSDTELQSVLVSSTPAPRTNEYYPPGYYVDEAFDKDTVVILDGIVTRDTAEQLLDTSGATLFIPEGVVGIDANAFAGMSVEKIILPDSLKAIGHSAFAGSQISEVVIPNSVSDIGEGAFAGTPLMNVDIGEAVRSIGDYAFAGTQITNIQLPGSLENIGEGAFAGTRFENGDFSQTKPVTEPEAEPETGAELETDIEVQAEPVLPDPVTEFDDSQIISEPVLLDPVFEFHDPLTGSEPIQFEGVLEPFDSLTNPNQVFAGTVSEFIEPDPFAFSGGEGMVIEPIDGLQGLSTDGPTEFSDEQLQADLVNSMAASTEVLA